MSRKLIYLFIVLVLFSACGRGLEDFEGVIRSKNDHILFEECESKKEFTIKGNLLKEWNRLFTDMENDGSVYLKFTAYRKHNSLEPVETTLVDTELKCY